MNFNPQASKGGFFGYALTNSEKSDTKVCTTTAMKSNYTIYHFCLGFICFDFFLLLVTHRGILSSRQLMIFTHNFTHDIEDCDRLRQYITLLPTSIFF